MKYIDIFIVISKKELINTEEQLAISEFFFEYSEAKESLKQKNKMFHNETNDHIILKKKISSKLCFIKK